MMSLGNFHIIYIVKEKLPISDFFKVKTMKKYFRDRKRNFVTAQTGFVGVGILMIGTIIIHFIYNFEFWTLETYRLDSSTKASVSTLCLCELMVLSTLYVEQDGPSLESSSYLNMTLRHLGPLDPGTTDPWLDL